MSGRLTCYNLNCPEKEFDPQINRPDSCTFHPGKPKFHDAYKIWSCCNRKSTDFTEFLNFKGCTTGPHSNEKPQKEPKQEVVEETPLPDREPIGEARVRPAVDAPLVPLEVDISGGLAKKLESFSATRAAITDDEKAEIGIGTACHNTSCRQTFDGTNLTGECLFHDGTAIFHEGMKYWSCCQRKTTDFNAFLDQAGCMTGKHVWRKKKVAAADMDRSSTARLDWYQTGDVVVVSIFSKLPIPSESLILANPVKLSIRIVFGEDRLEFEKDMTLFGIVDVQKSHVSYKETKVEITLKKDELVSWSRITF